MGLGTGTGLGVEYDQFNGPSGPYVPPTNYFLLQENGSYLLQEDGFKIKLS